MVSVTRTRRIAQPLDTVFPLLAEPENLPRLMPRIRAVDVGAPSVAGTPITAHFNLGSQLGQRATPGMFVAAGHTIAFLARQPLPVKAQWTLRPEGGATHIEALLEFDLKPLLGPLARFTPTGMVRARVGDELAAALARVEQLLAKPAP